MLTKERTIYRIVAKECRVTYDRWAGTAGGQLTVLGSMQFWKSWIEYLLPGGKLLAGLVVFILCQGIRAGY